ncbi:MAG: nucleotidyltransferase domain-containing protein [Euryarchaeota archaeon]|nr:nucleotidyltransferase domain-containing protein [Euryarchaeota archaeon]MBU4222185.1 nucleotidyltransferase domain-containing protein [Euryarchaeota archaeon]MCG2738474.1 nucleotidyltransferase domain-containing protein [Candidatus Methanoperedenaceae archaeon]
MLENLFTSKTRVKLLTLFLLNPGTELYVREIARRTNENTNAVRRELKNLEEIGLLTSARKGNLKYYAVNKSMSIYAELTNIILKTESVGKILTENLMKIGDIKAAFIYGSFAEGNAGGKSDIDLFIIGHVHEDELILCIEKLETQLSREINYVLFTPDELNGRIQNKDPFVRNVLKEKKVMLIGELSEY